MKKLLFFLVVAIFANPAFSQKFPVRQNNGSVSTLNTDYGARSFGRGIVIANFPDTSAANNVSYMKEEPYIIITTSDHSIWRRNSTATQWVKIGGGSGGSSIISYGKNPTGDSTVLVLSDGSRYAAIDNSWDFIVVTKLQADSLIAINKLKAGATYKISGVHPTLYDDGTTSGTTIFLQALTTNKFSADGHGIFYNPKYNQAVSGFGVWSNRSTWTAVAGAGDFNKNELITANNGATGQLFSNLEANIFIALTGDWTTATSITGNVSAATATISGVTLKTFAIGDKTIWGGYSWTNVNGNVGARASVLALNSEWTKDIYDTINYNIAIDAINYDYEKDFITSRYEASGDNLVVYTYADSKFQTKGHSIDVFMWGNPLRTETAGTATGIGGNRVYNSYVETVDFSGLRFQTNTFTGYSDVLTNVFTGTTSIYNNTFLNNANLHVNNLHNTLVYNNNITSDGSIMYNVTSNSQIKYNVGSGNVSTNTMMNSSYITGNILYNGGITSNTLNNSTIAINTLSNYAEISSNNLRNNARIETNSLVNTSYITQNAFVGGGIHDVKLSNYTILALGLAYPLTSKTIQYVTSEGGSGMTVSGDMSAATVLFSTYPKTLYKRPDGTIRLKYFNDADISVITPINY